MDDFCKPKIVYGQFQDGAEYSFASDHIYLSSNEYLLIVHEYSPKCLLAFLNSKASEWMLGNITWSLGGNSKIGQKSNFLKLPVPILSCEQQKSFDKLVEIVLDGKIECKDTQMVEHEIDLLVYQLYNLTKEEIAVVEKI